MKFRNIDPPLLLDFETIENILVVSVPSGPNKPYSSNGIFYIREAAKSQQMKRDEIREFFFREGLVRFDEQPCLKFDLQRDFDIRKYRDFIRAAAIPKGLAQKDVLRNLQVLTDQGLTNAGALLFSKQAIEKDQAISSKTGHRGGVNGGVTGGVKEGIEGLLESFRRDPGLKTPQIAIDLQLPVKTLENWLRQLKKQNIIAFRGGARSGGYWAKEDPDGGVMRE